MKTQSALLRSIGALALFVLIAFPSSSALAIGYCADPDVYYEYGGSTGIEVLMYSGPPYGATIFFTTNGNDPTHYGNIPGAGTSIYNGPYPVPYLSCRHFRALAWKGTHVPCLDSGISYLDVCNPPQ